MDTPITVSSTSGTNISETLSSYSAGNEDTVISTKTVSFGGKPLSWRKRNDVIASIDSKSTMSNIQKVSDWIKSIEHIETSKQIRNVNNIDQNMKYPMSVNMESNSDKESKSLILVRCDFNKSVTAKTYYPPLNAFNFSSPLISYFQSEQSMKLDPIPRNSQSSHHSSKISINTSINRNATMNKNNQKSVLVKGPDNDKRSKPVKFATGMNRKYSIDKDNFCSRVKITDEKSDGSSEIYEIPLSPESRKKELCSYLQLMNPADKKEIFILQNRRSTRVKNLAAVQEKRKREKKIRELEENLDKIEGQTETCVQLNFSKEPSMHVEKIKNNQDSSPVTFSETDGEIFYFPFPPKDLTESIDDFDIVMSKLVPRLKAICRSKKIKWHFKNSLKKSFLKNKENVLKSKLIHGRREMKKSISGNKETLLKRQSNKPKSCLKKLRSREIKENKSYINGFKRKHKNLQKVLQKNKKNSSRSNSLRSNGKLKNVTLKKLLGKKEKELSRWKKFKRNELKERQQEIKSNFDKPQKITPEVRSERNTTAKSVTSQCEIISVTPTEEDNMDLENFMDDLNDFNNLSEEHKKCLLENRILTKPVSRLPSIEDNVAQSFCSLQAVSPLYGFTKSDTIEVKKMCETYKNSALFRDSEIDILKFFSGPHPKGKISEITKNAGTKADVDSSSKIARKNKHNQADPVQSAECEKINLVSVYSTESSKINEHENMFPAQPDKYKQLGSVHVNSFEVTKRDESQITGFEKNCDILQAIPVDNLKHNLMGHEQTEVPAFHMEEEEYIKKDAAKSNGNCAKKNKRRKSQRYSIEDKGHNRNYPELRGENKDANNGQISTSTRDEHNQNYSEVNFVQNKCKNDNMASYLQAVKSKDGNLRQTCDKETFHLKTSECKTNACIKVKEASNEMTLQEPKEHNINYIAQTSKLKKHKIPVNSTTDEKEPNPNSLLETTENKDGNVEQTSTTKDEEQYQNYWPQPAESKKHNTLLAKPKKGNLNSNQRKVESKQLYVTEDDYPQPDTQTFERKMNAYAEDKKASKEVSLQKRDKEHNRSAKNKKRKRLMYPSEDKELIQNCLVQTTENKDGIMQMSTSTKDKDYSAQMTESIRGNIVRTKSKKDNKQPYPQAVRSRTYPVEEKDKESSNELPLQEHDYTGSANEGDDENIEVDVQTVPMKNLPVGNCMEVNPKCLTKNNKFELLPYNKTVEMKSLHRSLQCIKRKTTKNEIDPNIAQEWDADGSPKQKTKNQSHYINICRKNGAVLKAFYIDYNLIVCQEFLVSFWMQTPLGNVLGSQNMWIPRGDTQRLVLNNKCIQKESMEMIISMETNLVYIELWTKEHKSDIRQGPVADVFVTLYFSKQRQNGLDKKVLQLENINGFADDVQYSVMKCLPKIIVSWHSANEDSVSKRTFIHAYQLAADYQTVSNIYNIEPIEHYVSSLHNIEDCENLIMGCGDNKVTLWNVEHGYIIATIELTEIKSPLSTLWVRSDRGFLFALQQCVDRELRLVAINGHNHSWKKLASYFPPEGFDRLRGVYIENGLLLSFYDQGILCWKAETGEPVEEITLETDIIMSGKYVIFLEDNKMFVKHALTHIMSISVDES